MENLNDVFTRQYFTKLEALCFNIRQKLGIAVLEKQKHKEILLNFRIIESIP